MYLICDDKYSTHPSFLYLICAGMTGRKFPFQTVSCRCSRLTLTLYNISCLEEKNTFIVKLNENNVQPVAEETRNICHLKILFLKPKCFLIVLVVSSVVMKCNNSF